MLEVVSKPEPSLNFILLGGLQHIWSVKMLNVLPGPPKAYRKFIDSSDWKWRWKPGGTVLWEYGSIYTVSNTNHPRSSSNVGAKLQIFNSIDGRRILLRSRRCRSKKKKKKTLLSEFFETWHSLSKCAIYTLWALPGVWYKTIYLVIYGIRIKSIFKFGSNLPNRIILMPIS